MYKKNFNPHLQNDKLEKYLSQVFSLHKEYSNLTPYMKKNVLNISQAWILNLRKRQKLAKEYYQKEFNKQAYLITPLNPNAYTYSEKTEKIAKVPEILTYNSARIAIKLLEKENIINVERGSIYKLYKRRKKYYHPCTRIYLNTPFAWFTKLNYSDFDLIYLTLPHRDPQDNAKIKINEEERIRASEFENKQVNKINQVFKKANYPDLQYTRYFGYNESEYGRFYNSFQFLSSEERKELLKRMNWVEIDYKSFNPSICYFLSTGQHLTEDPYEKILIKLGLPIEYKKVIKTLFLSLFGSKSKKICLKSITNILCDYGIYINQPFTISLFDNKIKTFLKQKDLKENIKIKQYNDNPVNKYKLNFKDTVFVKEEFFKRFLKKFNLPLDTPHYVINSKYLYKLICEEHKEINNFFAVDACKQLQNIESQIIYKLMLKQIKHNILPLSIHDCVIVPKEYETLFINYSNTIKNEVLLKLYQNPQIFQNSTQISQNSKKLQNSIFLFKKYKLLKKREEREEGRKEKKQQPTHIKINITLYSYRGPPLILNFLYKTLNNNYFYNKIEKIKTFSFRERSFY